MLDGSRTGVSERLSSAHPVVTSARGTDRRAGFETEGVEEGAQSRVVLRFRWWKEDFMGMVREGCMVMLDGVSCTVASVWEVDGHDLTSSEWTGGK